MISASISSIGVDSGSLSKDFCDSDSTIVHELEKIEIIEDPSSDSSKCTTRSSSNPPIEIRQEFTTSIDLPPLCWYGFDTPPKILSVTNTGRTILINAQWGNSRPYINGGPLNGSYAFSQIHFHCPSEHEIDGKRYPLEMHVVYYKTSYLTQERAMHERDGTVVLAYLFEVTLTVKTALSQITNCASKLQKVNSRIELNDVHLDQIIIPFCSNYYVYWGSVSTEKNSYLLQWIINCSSMKVAKQEIDDLLSIMGSFESSSNKHSSRMKPENNAIYRVGEEDYSCKTPPLPSPPSPPLPPMPQPLTPPMLPMSPRSPILSPKSLTKSLISSPKSFLSPRSLFSPVSPKSPISLPPSPFKQTETKTCTSSGTVSEVTSFYGEFDIWEKSEDSEGAISCKCKVMQTETSVQNYPPSNKSCSTSVRTYATPDRPYTTPDRSHSHSERTYCPPNKSYSHSERSYSPSNRICEEHQEHVVKRHVPKICYNCGGLKGKYFSCTCRSIEAVSKKTCRGEHEVKSTSASKSVSRKPPPKKVKKRKFYCRARCCEPEKPSESSHTLEKKKSKNKKAPIQNSEGPSETEKSGSKSDSESEDQRKNKKKKRKKKKKSDTRDRKKSPSTKESSASTELKKDEKNDNKVSESSKDPNDPNDQTPSKTNGEICTCGKESDKKVDFKSFLTSKLLFPQPKAMSESCVCDKRRNLELQTKPSSAPSAAGDEFKTVKKENDKKANESQEPVSKPSNSTTNEEKPSTFKKVMDCCKSKSFQEVGVPVIRLMESVISKYRVKSPTKTSAEQVEQVEEAEKVEERKSAVTVDESTCTECDKQCKILKRATVVECQENEDSASVSLDSRENEGNEAECSYDNAKDSKEVNVNYLLMPKNNLDNSSGGLQLSDSEGSNKKNNCYIIQECTADQNFLSGFNNASDSPKEPDKDVCIFVEHLFRTDNPDGYVSITTSQEYHVSIVYDQNIIQEYKGIFNPNQLKLGNYEMLDLVPQIPESSHTDIQVQDCTVKKESFNEVCIRAKFKIKELKYKWIYSDFDSNWDVRQEQKTIEVYDKQTQNNCKEIEIFRKKSTKVCEEIQCDPKLFDRITTEFSLEEKPLLKNINKALNETNDKSTFIEKEFNLNTYNIPETPLKPKSSLWNTRKELNIANKTDLKVDEDIQCDSTGSISKASTLQKSESRIKIIEVPDQQKKEEDEASEKERAPECVIKILKNPEIALKEKSGNGHGKEKIHIETSSDKIIRTTKSSILNRKKTVYFMYDKVEKEESTGKKIFVGSFKTKTDVDFQNKRSKLFNDYTKMMKKTKENNETKYLLTFASKKSDVEIVQLEPVAEKPKKSCQKQSLPTTSNALTSKKADVITLHKYKPKFSKTDHKAQCKNLSGGKTSYHLHRNTKNFSDLTQLLGVEEDNTPINVIYELQESSDSNNSELRDKSFKKNLFFIQDQHSFGQYKLFVPKNSLRTQIDRKSKNSSDRQESRNALVIIPVEVESISGTEVILKKKKPKKNEYIPCLKYNK